MRTRPRQGLTLLELVVVIAILVALAALVIPLVSEQSISAKETVTRTNMVQIRDALLRYRIDNPSETLDQSDTTVHRVRVGDLISNHKGLANWDPVTRTGWNGPYLSSGGASYTFDGNSGFSPTYGTGASTDLCVLDAFAQPNGQRRPIVLVSRTIGGQLYAWLQSAGPNGTLEIPDALAGPPKTHSGGSGTDFPTSTGTTTVDDLTLLVHP